MNTRQLATDEAHQLLAAVLDDAGAAMRAMARQIGPNIGTSNPPYVRLMLDSLLKQIADDPPYDIYQIVKRHITDDEDRQLDLICDDCTAAMRVTIKQLRKVLTDEQA